jgi:uncharacterized repeat protein (TIGR01451 family)
VACPDYQPIPHYTPSNTPAIIGGSSQDPLLPNPYSWAYSTYNSKNPNKNLIAVSSLAPYSKELTPGQIIPFLMVITVDQGSSSGGAIQFTTDFDTNTTSGDNFGYDPKYGVYSAFVDTSDPATTNKNAKLTSYTSNLMGSGTNQYVEGTFNVEGLNSGDTVVIEVWVVLDQLNSKATGTVHASVKDAMTASGDINVGKQAIPLQVSGFPGLNNPGLTITKSASPLSYDSVGQTITYTYTVTNSGNVDLTGLQLTDDQVTGLIPLQNSGNTVTSLSPGDQATGTATYKITEADIDAGYVKNSAYATNKDIKSNTVTAKVTYEKPTNEEENNEGPGYGGALVPMPMYGSPMYASEPSGTTEVPNSCKPTVSLSKHNHKNHSKHHKAEKNHSNHHKARKNHSKHHKAEKNC